MASTLQKFNRLPTTEENDLWLSSGGSDDPIKIRANTAQRRITRNNIVNLVRSSETDFARNK